jgi:hypothetical protein
MSILSQICSVFSDIAITFAWGFVRYKFRHEPNSYAHVAGEKDPWYGDKSQSTLWEENKPAANRIHPNVHSLSI